MWKVNKKAGYIIHKTANRFLLCKIINEYNSQQEADQELSELLSNKKKEKELLKEYSKKPI